MNTAAMKKRIKARDLKVGMYLVELCGSWMEHPFWSTRFLLKDPADIQRIQDSGIDEVVIDTSRGIDVGSNTTAASDTAARAERTLKAAVRSAARGQATTLTQELQQAAGICARSRQAVVNMFSEVRMGKAVTMDSVEPLVNDISDSVARHPTALLGLVRIKTADEYTYMHSVAVCALMIALARQLQLDEATTRELGLAGLLHDVGKAFVPNDILNKPGRLNDAEFKAVQSHPAKGYAALIEAGGASDIVLDVVRHHHEKLNGKGYPDSRPAEQISLFARMGAICDVYDAITSDRPYKKGWDPAEAIRRMAEWCGHHLDEKLFQHFVKAIGIYPTGSLVRLKSGRLAVVKEQNPKALLSPVVVMFYSCNAKAAIPPQSLDLSRPGVSEQIVGREDPDSWGFSNLEQLWSGLQNPRQGRPDI